MSGSTPSNHKELIALIKRISGQAGFIGTPRIYVDIFDGDLVAAVWFNQVVFHDGDTDSPVGFCMTDEEFEEELGLSFFQSRRARRLCKERGLIKTSFKKHYGTPKIHYLVLWDEFIKVVTETLERKKQEKEAKKASDLQQSKRSDLQQSVRSEVKDSKTSELEDSSRSLEVQESEISFNQEENQERINEEEEEVSLPEIESAPLLLVEKLDLAFDPKTFGKLAIRKGYLDHSSAFILGYIAKGYQDQSRLKDPLAFIAARLKKTTPPDVYYLQNFRDILPDAYLEAIGLSLYECPDCEETFKKRSELSEHWEARHSTQEDEEIEIPEEKNPEASRAWQIITGQLSMEMPRASFDTWVRNTRAISLENDVLIVWAPTAYSREWIESRLASTVDRLLVGILNRSASVSFVTGGVDG